MPKWNESNFFEIAKKLPPGTQTALRKLYALREAEGVNVEWGDGGISPRFKVKLDKVGNASLFFAQADDGQLLFTFDQHQGNSIIVEPLGKLLEKTMCAPLKDGWRGKKQYVIAGDWVPHVESLVALVTSLAEPGK